MPVLFSAVSGGLLLVASLIFAAAYFSRRKRRSGSSAAHNPPEKPFYPRVLWDASDHTTKPSVRDGVLYIGRRNAIISGVGSLLGLVGIAVLSRSAKSIPDHLRPNSPGGLNSEVAHFDVPAQHNDTPHHDTTPHSDSKDGNGGHIDENLTHQDNSHGDTMSAHTDNPNG